MFNLRYPFIYIYICIHHCIHIYIYIYYIFSYFIKSAMVMVLHIKIVVDGNKSDLLANGGRVGEVLGPEWFKNY